MFDKLTLQIWWRVNQPFILFIHRIWDTWGKQYYQTPFVYFTDLGQNLLFLALFKLIVLQFFYSFSRQFFRVLTLNEMLPYFVFYEHLAVAQATTTTSDVFFRFSLEWPNDALFGKEMAVGLGLGLFCDALSNWDINVYLSVHLESWNRCTCTSLSDGFHSYWSSVFSSIECFHMMSRRPYWCPKTTKRRPYWCPKPILREFTSFLMQTLSFVLINLHRCWPREWKHSIFRGELQLLWTTNVSMVTKWSWSRYILPFYTQSSFQVYLNYSTPVWNQVTITGGFIF